MPEALIWGASGGIGAALVSALKARGWKVYAAARTEDRIPPEADFRVAFDANHPYSIKEASTLIAYETTGVDLVVYAAGGIAAQPLSDIDADTWTRVINANLTGAQLTAQSSINLLNEGGALMFIGAYVDKIQLPRFGAYTAAKAGLEALAAILSKEQRKLKISIVRPPAVATPFWDNVPFKLPNGALTPEQVAEAIIAHYDSGTGGALDL